MSEPQTLRFLRRQIGGLKADIQKFFEDRRFRDPAQWRKAHPLLEPNDDVVVRFIVPLISPEKARNWTAVCDNLFKTVASLRGQTSDRWEVTICCQQEPDLIRWDEKVRFLEFPIPPDPSGNDKPRKQRHMIRHLAATDRKDGYLFFLDADDLLHPRLVEFMVSDNNGHGYSASTGYMVDFAMKKAVALGIPGEQHPDERRPFYRLCGSSAALRFDLRQDSECVGPAYKRGAHGNIKSNVKKFGLILEDIPFPAALYVFNHGDNLQSHRGVDADKQALLATTPEDPSSFERIMQEFGVPETVWRS